MTEFFNRSEQTERRRELRNQPAPAEVLLWSVLKGRQICGVKFRRQFGVGAYILDFYCPSLRLCVELDGDSHFQPTARAKDAVRDQFLERNGICVVRFLNVDVYENLEGVCEAIARAAREQQANMDIGLQSRRKIRGTGNSVRDLRRQEADGAEDVG